MSEGDEGFYDSMKAYIRKAVNTASAAIVGGTLLLTALGSVHTTGTTEVGVRTIKWSPFAKSGIERKIYQPGSTYFFPPVINDWTTYDIKNVNVEMSGNPKESDTGRADDLTFKTRDGNDIRLDVVFSYRIDPAKTPYIREFVASSDEEVKYKIVRTIGRSRPRDLFGELSSEEFYQTEKRNEASEKAKKTLQDLLEPFGVIVERIAPKDYRFNPHYTEAIMNKKLAEAKELEFRSQINAQKEENVRMLKEADGTYNEKIAKIDGEYKQAVIQVDAYYDQQAKIAEAIVAEGKAEAAGIKAERAAMMSAGGSTLVKMKIAESLQGKKIIMVPSGGTAGNINLQTLDINDFLKFKGIQNLEGKVDSK